MNNVVGTKMKRKKNIWKSVNRRMMFLYKFCLPLHQIPLAYSLPKIVI